MACLQKKKGRFDLRWSVCTLLMLRADYTRPFRLLLVARQLQMFFYLNHPGDCFALILEGCNGLWVALQLSSVCNT